jgi:hypothetical protein
MKIIGVDSGDTTGCSVFIDGDFKEGFEFTKIGPLAKLIREVKPDIIVAEKFTILGAKARGDRALKILGGVELLQSDMGFKLIYQSPAILGIWLPRATGLHRSVHVRSASCHVLCYLRRQDRVGK